MNKKCDYRLFKFRFLVLFFDNFIKRNSTFPDNYSTFAERKSTFSERNSTFPNNNCTFPYNNSTFIEKNSTFPILLIENEYSNTPYGKETKVTAIISQSACNSKVYRFKCSI